MVAEALRLVQLSGGKDSVAMALILHEQGVDFELVFADTGAELPETYAHVLRVAGYLGKKLNVVQNGTFFEHLKRRNFFLPGPKRRWCTDELKTKPLRKFCDREGCVVYIGFRADEAGRAESQSKRYWKYAEVRYPLIEFGLGKEDVFAICRAHDLLNPVYTWRSSVSCFCCPFQRKSDWIGLLRHHPDLYALAESWEVQAKRRWNHVSLVELRRQYETQLWLFEERTSSVSEGEEGGGMDDHTG